MKYEYKIEKEDLLALQLYTASKSEVLDKKRKNGRFLLVLVSAIFAGYFYTNNEIIIGVYFSLMIVLALFFYNIYFTWIKKFNYGRFIRTNYSSRFGMIEKLETFSDKIHVQDDFGEGDVKASAFENCAETSTHFFLKLDGGTSLVIPKGQIESEAFKKDLKKLKIPLIEELSWTWKF